MLLRYRQALVEEVSESLVFAPFTDLCCLSSSLRSTPCLLDSVIAAAGMLDTSTDLVYSFSVSPTILCLLRHLLELLHLLWNREWSPVFARLGADKSEATTPVYIRMEDTVPDDGISVPSTWVGLLYGASQLTAVAHSTWKAGASHGSDRAAWYPSRGGREGYLESIAQSTKSTQHRCPKLLDAFSQTVQIQDSACIVRLGNGTVVWHRWRSICECTHEHVEKGTLVDAKHKYAPTLFHQAGLPEQTAGFLASGISAILLLLVSIPAVFYADSWKRRTSVIAGGVLLTSCMCKCFDNTDHPHAL